MNILQHKLTFFFSILSLFLSINSLALAADKLELSGTSSDFHESDGEDNLRGSSQNDNLTKETDQVAAPVASSKLVSTGKSLGNFFQSFIWGTLDRFDPKNLKNTPNTDEGLKKISDSLVNLYSVTNVYHDEPCRNLSVTAGRSIIGGKIFKLRIWAMKLINSYKLYLTTYDSNIKPLLSDHEKKQFETKLSDLKQNSELANKAVDKISQGKFDDAVQLLKEVDTGSELNIKVANKMSINLSMDKNNLNIALDSVSKLFKSPCQLADDALAPAGESGNEFSALFANQMNLLNQLDNAKAISQQAEQEIQKIKTNKEIDKLNPDEKSRILTSLKTIAANNEDLILGNLSENLDKLKKFNNELMASSDNADKIWQEMATKNPLDWNDYIKNNFKAAKENRDKMAIALRDHINLTEKILNDKMEETLKKK